MMEEKLKKLSHTYEVQGFIIKPESETDWLYTYYKGHSAPVKGQPLRISAVPVFITDEEQSEDLTALNEILSLPNKQSSQFKLQNYFTKIFKNHFYLDKTALSNQKISDKPKLVFEPATANEMNPLIRAHNETAKTLQKKQPT